MHNLSTPPLTHSVNCRIQLLRKGLLMWVLVGFTGAISAQSKVPKKAQKRLDAAVDLYMKRDARGAADAVNGALALYHDFPEAWMLKSQLLEGQSDWSGAAEALATAVAVKPDWMRKWREKLVQLHFRAGDYSEAYALVSEVACTDTLLDASVRFAFDAVSHPVELTLAPLPGDVNSSAPEYYPALYASGDRMVFTRQLGGDARMTGQEDFFEAAQDASGAWLVVRALSEINTPGNEGAPTVRGDGRQLIFTACDGLNGSYGRRTGEGSCDLFVADFDVASRRFGTETNLEAVNSRAWESQPSLSADGHWLFFVRAYRNQNGEVVQDIYQSENLGAEGWSRPARLPAEINTPGREENPVLHSDGKTLYFASNGHVGMGGLDLYVSRRQPDGSWSKAENLGYPINSQGDENSLQVFPDGQTALFATDREEAGNLDLWQFQLPDYAAAESVAMWRGQVVDAESGRAIASTVQVLDAAGNRIGQQRSSPVDGEFTLTFPSSESVFLQIEEEGYGFYSVALDPSEAQEPYVTVALQPLKVGTVLVLNDVRFERSSALLDPNFQPDLAQLARTLATSNIRIRIAGHTDGEGTKERNQALSEARAEAVANYLKSLGIQPERMETVGYGMSRPIATNDTPEGRAMNRRTEIEVIQ